MPVGDSGRFDIFEYSVVVIVADSWAGADFSMIWSSGETREFRVSEDLTEVFECFDCYVTVRRVVVVLFSPLAFLGYASDA